MTGVQTCALPIFGQKQPQALIQQQRQKISQLQKQRLEQIQKQRTTLKTVQVSKLKTFQQQTQKQRLKKGTLQILDPFRKKSRGILPLPFGGKPKKRKKKLKIPPVKIGYNILIKKKGKFKRMNVVPLTKSKARDLGAFLTDKSVARTFKIKQSDSIAKKPKLKVPSSYFKRHQKKFRGRKVKGRFQPIRRVAIEKSKFAIDSRGEIGRASCRERV